MMKFIHKLTIVLALGGICGLAACSDDDQGFLKRNLREMSFPYVESSDTFTIRATGDWQISDTPDSREWTNAYGWVHVDQLSGKGDPGTYQKVTVTCDQNTSEERNATIYLHGCGEENVAIAIRQDNGIFEWKPFDNGQQFDVSGMLKLNAEAGAKLRIPYIKALGTEKYTVTVTQTGGEGITAASGSYSISAAGNGYIEVPLTGTATRQGIVTFAVKAMDEAGAQMERCPRCDFLHGRLLERFGLSPRKRVCLQDRHRVHGNVAGADQPGKQHLLLGQGQGGRQPRFRLVGNGERHDHGQRRRAAPSDGRPARRGVPQRRFGYGQLLVGNARAADAVIEAVKAKGLTDRVEYIAFDYTTCKRIVNALPGAMVQYLNGDLAPAAVRQDGIGGIDYRFSAYSGNPGWVKEAHANGMVTNVWTVDTVQDMMTCIAWGMDFITTNNPETLKELLTRTFVSAN